MVSSYENKTISEILFLFKSERTTKTASSSSHSSSIIFLFYSMFLFVNIYFKLCDPVLHKISYNFSLSRIFENFHGSSKQCIWSELLCCTDIILMNQGITPTQPIAGVWFLKPSQLKKHAITFFNIKYFSTKQAKFLLCYFSSQDAENRLCFKG